MENMTKELEPREVLFKYPQLRHLEIKVGSLEMAAIECAMREYAIEFQKFSLYKDHPTTASGSVAAPKEEGALEQIIKDVVGIKPDAPPITPMDYGECKECMKQYAASLRQQLKEREEALKELLPMAEYYRITVDNPDWEDENFRVKDIIERACKLISK